MSAPAAGVLTSWGLRPSIVFPPHRRCVIACTTLLSLVEGEVARFFNLSEHQQRLARGTHTAAPHLALGLIRGDSSRSAPPERAHQGAGNRGEPLLLSQPNNVLSALSFRFRTRKHIDNRHHTGVYHTTRRYHRNALPPRRRVGPEAASSSRAARACCAGRCLASYILHSLWFPAQAPDIVGLLPRDPAECPSIPRQLYM